MALAEGDPEIEYALDALHDLFVQAPILGSLLEPSGGDLFETARMGEVERLLDQLLTKTRNVEPEQVEGAIAARGMADAASLLVRKYTLQATNVPFLARGKQANFLARYIERRYYLARTDLATVMFCRMMNFASLGGTVTAVTPQNWLYQTTYRGLRKDIVSRYEIAILATLGTQAFGSIGGWVVNTILIGLTRTMPTPNSRFFLE